MPRQERIVAYDLIRSFAILCVLSIHSIEGLIYYDVIMYKTTLPFWDWILQTIIYIIGRLGVPMFLMLTGALLLPRTIQSIKVHFKQKVLPLYAITVSWLMIYHVFYIIKNHTSLENIKVIKLIVSSLFLDTSIGLHFWYMPVIIGIYVFIPIMSRIVETFSSNSLILYSSIVLGMFSLLPTLWRFLLVNNIPNFVGNLFNMQTGFLFGLYPMYCLWGYLCSERRILEKIKTSWLLVLFITCFIILTLLQYQCYYKQNPEFGYYFWYDDFFIVLLSLLLYELMSRIKFKKNIENIFNRLSKASFGIYLVHILLLYTIMNYVKNQTAWGWEKQYLVLFGFTLLSSWFISSLFQRIPLLKKIV